MLYSKGKQTSKRCWLRVRQDVRFCAHSLGSRLGVSRLAVRPLPLLRGGGNAHTRQRLADLGERYVRRLRRAPREREHAVLAEGGRGRLGGRRVGALSAPALAAEYREASMKFSKPSSWAKSSFHLEMRS